MYLIWLTHDHDLSQVMVPTSSGTFELEIMPHFPGVAERAAAELCDAHKNVFQIENADQLRRCVQVVAAHVSSEVAKATTLTPPTASAESSAAPVEASATDSAPAQGEDDSLKIAVSSFVRSDDITDPKLSQCI